MVLNFLKKKGIVKKTNHILKQQKEDFVSFRKELHTVAVLVDTASKVQLPIDKLASALEISIDQIQVLEFGVNSKVQKSSVKAAFYSPKSFGPSGTIRSKTLQDFVSYDFDIWISFYSNPKPELDYIAAASKAKYKVGNSQIDSRIHDLILGVDTNKPDLFISELKKYLKILQII